MPPKNTQKPARRRMISTQLAKFDVEGVSVTGTLMLKEQQTLSGNEVGRYVLKNSGITFIVNGTVQLDEAMANAEVGQEIEIIYIGESVTQAGWKVKNFEVYVLEGEDSDGEE